MQEFFYTVLAIWVIWKLFSVFSSSSSRKETSRQYYQTNHHHYHQKQEGDVTIQKYNPQEKRKPDSDTEYTDYEEIK